MLVHTNDKPTETLNAFGNRLLPIPKNLQTTLTSLVSPKLPISVPPLIAATHLDLYEQCRLRFAAYHEGRFLPQWTIQQSMGSRIHKSLEYYLRADMPKDVDVINQCFNDGFRDGDSPLRKLPMAVVKKMKFGYQNMVKEISANFVQVLGVEKRYRYLHGHLGQIEGIVDAILKAKDGRTVLCEWKSSHQTAGAKKRQYQLQARAGALGLKALQSIPIDKIQIVPIFNPKARLTFSRNRDFDRHSKEMLDKVFTDLKDPTCEPRKGSHCKECELRRNCPAWPMR
jgi:CRISPR/Cas system-associated exonuclease Cas4 (RecB family)